VTHHRIIRLAFLVVGIASAAALAQPPNLGYYRQPAIHGDTIVFVSEGDLWKVPAVGGAATRLTSHAGDESRPAISPDGKTLAFSAAYEGPTEVYTMPLAGGLPTRRTFEGDVSVVGWTPDGRILAALKRYSTLPSEQLLLIDPRSDAAPRTLVPLAQAADGCYDESGKTLFFTRLPFQGSHTRRYKGGTAQNLWRFAEGDAEAAPLTADYAGTSRRPMLHADRVYFASDRDGVMNLWSMKPDGTDVQQHTKHKDYEVLGTSLGGGRIVYQHGADIRVFDIAAGSDRAVPITLDSDFDQTRERWITEPAEWITAAALAPDGSSVALTARGRVFVAPHRQGRIVDVARKDGVRRRNARFMPNGKSVIYLSDESGEIELWKAPANGVGEPEQLTKDAAVLRWEALAAPDGKRIAHHDKNQRLWILDVESRENRKIDEGGIDNFADLAWSPDGQWLAYVKPAENMFRTIRLYSVADGSISDVVSDRWDSYSPAWSGDGKWLYFLSDRNLQSVVDSPWGAYQPEPFLDKRAKVFALALVPGERFPFAPASELDKKDEKSDAASQPATASASAPTTASAPAAEKKLTPVKIEKAGLAERLYEAPIAAGNYGALAVAEKALFFTSTDSIERKTALVGVAIARENVETKTVLADIRSYELSLDGKKLLIRKGDALHIVDAAAAPADLDKKNVNLAGWALSLTPREEWRQMFKEAWRLERDYFYDPRMHGVDWNAMLAKYLPLVDRVRTRGELSDLTAQLVAELCALHIYVTPGDGRRGTDRIRPASLGALLSKAADGWRVERLYRSDPEEPALLSPLARPDVNIREGDVIEAINGVSTLAVADVSLLLRQKAGQQVLVRVKPVDGPSRDAIVRPLSDAEADDLRYRDWEHSRRLEVEKQSDGTFGYVHLRAMGGGNFTEWAKNFYPAFNRDGLIIDVRHNRGGNIDSWILGRLLRKAWFTWSQRVGQPPSWNMQYAFRGHVVVLCNEFTASDGEAFAEGIKRLGIGKVIGTRTWGGEIWLSFSNTLVDNGIASAAEYGVFGPEGTWLIEGHGVDPDIVVDNLPHATFKGRDAQLEAAIAYLKQQVRDKPIPKVQSPRHPDKALK
jgi:tricorn protease